ncbi:MAG: potassium channel family protein [Planctomycetota bacterium]
MSRRKYAVLGLGEFGRAVALELSQLGREVLAIDINPKRVEEVQEHVALAAVADVREREALQELMETPFDVAVVATGGNFEAAILATLHLRAMGVTELVAEASSEERADVLLRVGATRIVSPELDMGKRLARRLGRKNLVEFIPLSPGYAVVEIEAPESLIGKTLAEADVRRKYHVAVIALRSRDGTDTLIPGGATPISPGDRLTLAGGEEAIERFSNLT